MNVNALSKVIEAGKLCLMLIIGFTFTIKRFQFLLSTQLKKNSEINAARFTTSDIPRIHGSDQSKYTGVRIYSL